MEEMVSVREWTARQHVACRGRVCHRAALFVADVYHHIFFSKTPYLFLLGWVSLRLRGMRWKDVGFARPRSWRTAIPGGNRWPAFASRRLSFFVSQPLLARWLGKMPDLSNFTVVHGNLKITLVYLLLIWVLAAFGEELVYRGYLMNRVAGVFRKTRAAWVVSLIVISVVFGCSHIGQGVTGIARKHLGWAAARSSVSGVRP